ncbi:coiled-coil domain containing 169 [Polyodon spathula]|uniref:coiled-coil domain containing 169 n=1 Tax=Polyodon spathula TaxID=7913 RepID=UPI001B7EBFE6|nr:coiled-coil domain containing 169 [Polyodon spathula]
MDDADFINYDTDRLRIELEQEKQMKEMLEQSASELRNTVADLEKRLSNVEDEGNEWKTRFETQQELNRQLERQINLLQDKMESICGNPADRLSSIRSYDEMPVGALKQILKQLEMDKNSLQNQLKDYTLRIEQEAKAYHKTNDERRTYLTEISKASTGTDATKKQQVAQAQGTQGHQMMKGNFNVANNKRVLHPNKGAIKKTAAVTRLPKLKC